MNDTQSFTKKIVRGSLTVLFLSFLGTVFAYLVRVLYSHTLTIEDYGLFYAVLSLFLIFTAYNDLGFGYSTVYLLPKYIKLKNYSKSWNIFIYGQITSLIMSVIISSIMVILAPMLAKHYFKVAGSEILIYIFCFYLIVFSLINGLIQIYSGMQKEKYYSSITISRWFLSFILSVLFFLFGFSNVVFFAIALVLGHLATALIYFVLLFRKYSFLTNNKIVWERKTFKQIVSLAAPSLLDTLISSILIITVTFFLTLFKGVREVGIYNIVFPLATIPLLLFNPLNTLLLPIVSHLMEGEKVKLENLIEKILQIVPFVGLYFSLFLISFPSASVGLIFGQKWQGITEIPLSFMSLGAICILTSGILGAITLGIGKVNERLRVTTIITIVGIFLNALFIWHYGIIGAVIITSLAALTTCVLLLKIISDTLSFKIPFYFYLKLLIYSSIFYITVRSLKIDPQSWLEFITVVLIYSIVYILFGFLLKIYDRKLIMVVLPDKYLKLKFFRF